MSSVVNSLADDEDAFPWDDPETEEDESIDGVCEDWQHRCTLRAALEEAGYMGVPAVVAFGVTGTIVVDSLMGTFGPPNHSTVSASNREITIQGSGSYSFLMVVDTGCTVRGLVFRDATEGLDVAGPRNIIHDNVFLGMDQAGINLIGDSNLVIENQIGVGGYGNAIGIAPNGDTVYNQFGVFVLGSGNIIGGLHSNATGNTISRNLIGISIVGAESTDLGMGTKILGNNIGTDSAGILKQSNGYGIEMLYGGEHVVGTADPDPANIISGNREAGILVGIGTHDVVITGNTIGANSVGGPVPNDNGIILGPGSYGDEISGNTIHHNTSYGIEVAGGHAAFNYPSHHHLISGNDIRSNGAGIALVSRATDNIVGSSLGQDHAANTIQENIQYGVLISSPGGTPNEAQRNTVRKNHFLDNGGDGITIIQSQDIIAPPSLTSYTRAGAQAYITGMHDRPGSVIDVYDGRKITDTWWEGYDWLGSSTVQGDSTFIVAFDTCTCDPVAATATDPQGNTSQFSILQEGADVLILGSINVSNGWNMLSVPVSPVNPLVDSLFPGRISNLFAFTPSGYAATATATHGPGYWLNYGSGGSVQVSGYALPEDTFTVNAGWNMVGSITDPVPVSQITSVPGGMIASNFFAYSAGYQAADTITPGKAYWVKMAQAGSLILSSSDGARPEARISIVPAGEVPPPPPTVSGNLLSFPATVRGSAASALLYPVRTTDLDPASGMVTVRFRLPSDGPVTLSVLDAAGRIIAAPVEGPLTAGMHTLSVPVSSLPEGVFLFRLEAGGGSSVSRFTVGRPSPLVRAGKKTTGTMTGRTPD